MTLPHDIDTLGNQRDQLRHQLAEIGDLRPGSLVPSYRKCGKPTCRCSTKGHPGHGPHWILTHKVKGKTRTRVIPSSEVEKTRAQIAECQRLRRLVGELVEVSEELCQARIEQSRPEAGEGDARKKKPAQRLSPKRSPPRSKD